MKSVIAYVVASAGALLFSFSANAAVVVDQEQPLIDEGAGFLGVGGDSEQKLAQSFTVGVDGDLAGLRLPIAGCGRGDLLIEIRRMSSGQPTGALLRSVTISGSDIPFAYDGFTDLFFRVPLAVNAGDVLAFTIQTVGEGSYCSYATAPNGELYPRGQGFFDARPNPPGWISFKGFPSGPQDLAFFTLMDDPSSGGGPGRNCVAQTSGGAIPTPIDFYAPACRCFEDRGLNEFRCGFLHPDFFIIRRIPLPLPPGSAYAEIWQFTPLADLDGPVRISVSGGGLPQSTKFVFSSKGKRRNMQTLKLSGVAPKQAMDVKGLAVIEYDMQDAQSDMQRAFGIDTTIYADQIGQ